MANASQFTLLLGSTSCGNRPVRRAIPSITRREVESIVMTGTIKTLRADKGFGFIRDTSGKEVFFHSSAIYGEGIDNLREGDGVEFDLEDSPKGPRATNVRRTTT